MTLEEHVAYSLLNFYQSRDRIEVVSFHPPSGKAYDSALVRFPILNNIGLAGKRRHLDFIVRCGRFLILQELKGDASSLVEDVLKLQNLESELGIDGIVQTIAKRVPRIRNMPKIDRLVLSVGYSKINGVIPGIFSTFCVDDQGLVTWKWGTDLIIGEQDELNTFLNSVEV